MTKDLYEIPVESHPTGVPNTGGVGENCVFWLSTILKRITVENLCLFATLVRVHDSALAEEYAVFSTTLVVVEVGWSQLRTSCHQQGWLYRSLLMTRTVLHAHCVIDEPTTTMRVQNYTE